MCPLLVEIGLTDLSKTVGHVPPPTPSRPLATGLHIDVQVQCDLQKIGGLNKFSIIKLLVVNCLDVKNQSKQKQLLKLPS